MNLNNLDLNKLAVFSKVVDAGNYRLASEVLNVTPSALSQTIAALEHALGIPLFHRIGKKLVVTESGEKIHREFKSHFAAFSDALSRMEQTSKKASGLLYVGAYQEFAKFRLAPVLAKFQKAHPDVQVKLVFDTPSRLHRLLETKKLDVCFSIYPERGSSLIQSVPIYREELVLVSPPQLLKPKPKLEEILDSPIIEYYLNHQPIRRWIWLHYQRKPKHLNIRTFGATAEMVFTLVQEGIGIGVVPAYLLGKKAMVCRPTEKKLMDSIWMLQLKQARRSVALEAFTESVNEAFSQ